jgi:hypothetical protein
MSRFRQLALAGALTLAMVGTACSGDNGGRGYNRGWWGLSDDRHDNWAERKYERMKDNDRSGDAARFNDRLCRNGIPGDAPAGCGD